MEGTVRQQIRKAAVDPNLILLVEDDFVLRGALSELLREDGFAVESAANGIEALQRLNRVPRPALVLLDIMLPHMDGLTFRAAQLAMPSVASIPVIVISAVGIGNTPGLSFTRTFTKPLDTEKLLLSIHETLDPPKE
jgi:two-component system chemotaxis response regulator CheY